ncbi:MAG: biotin--[acetyl-CoA-carboxylase] ligase [Bacteroidales bacterium]|nr:biotin--[acetyl-CoA-carboxylase] ligase [Bacteroidales bacterium]
MKIHLDEVLSTNTWALEQLKDGKNLQDGTVIWTTRQTAGRGQVGNTWESEADKNLTFSLVLRPTYLAPRDQFAISEIAALSVLKTLCSILPSRYAKHLSVKWPNDIYVGDDKICGMLIENQLQGTEFAYSIIGIGININQEKWVGGAPNPTSVKLLSGKDAPIEPILDEVVSRIVTASEALCANPEAMAAKVHDDFVAHLYRRKGFHPYVDVKSGEPFMGKIREIEPSGRLQMEYKTGEVRVYGFKEVHFVLPCGVTKE